MAYKLSAILTLGGELSNRIDEATFRARRLPESRRQLHLAFLWAALLNCLFFISDWRFSGASYFAVAMASRATIVLGSLLGLACLGAIRTFGQLQILCFAWGLPVIAASAGLMRPHTELALFATCMLPIVFYLALPISFHGTLALGISCSLATLAAFITGNPWSGANPGLIFSVATINTVLILVLIRINRLQRLEWLATRAAEASSAVLSEHHRTLETLLHAVPVPLIITAQESGRLLQANDAARAYFGAEALHEAFSIQDFLDQPGTQAHPPSLPEDGRPQEVEVRLRMPNSDRRDALLVTALAMVGGSKAILTIVIDMTRRKELEAHLRQLAATDPLTGLANRTRFFSKSVAEIRRAQRHGHPLAVVMLDIDHFKRINDTDGHEAGDAALKAFADLCRVVVRNQDLVARVGGEEFALLLPETEAEGALELANRLREAVAGLRTGANNRSMTVSLGVSEWRSQETTVEAALNRADKALYEAKQSGRNQAKVYAPVSAGNPDWIET